MNASKGKEEEEHQYFQRSWGQILLQMNENMALFIDHTQHVYAFARIHFELRFEPIGIDENVFSLPLDEPQY